MSRHPVEGDLRASLDGELSLWRRVQVRLHVRNCPHCSDRQARILMTSARTTKLLATVAAPPNLSESWERVNARASGPRALTSRAIASFPVRGLALAGAFATGLVLLSAPWSRGSGKQHILAGQVVQDICCGDHNGDGLANEGVLHFVTDKGQQAVSVTYSDRDRSRSFTSGDIVHAVYRAPRRP